MFIENCDKILLLISYYRPACTVYSHAHRYRRDAVRYVIAAEDLYFC